MPLFKIIKVISISLCIDIDITLNSFETHIPTINSDHTMLVSTSFSTAGYRYLLDSKWLFLLDLVTDSLKSDRSGVTQSRKPMAMPMAMPMAVGKRMRAGVHDGATASSPRVGNAAMRACTSQRTGIAPTALLLVWACAWLPMVLSGATI